MPTVTESNPHPENDHNFQTATRNKTVALLARNYHLSTATLKYFVNKTIVRNK